MKTFLCIIWQMIKNIFRKDCTHRFIQNEVIDLSIDPKCIYCKEKLSVLEKQFNL